jgi:hypothetical protein
MNLYFRFVCVVARPRVVLTLLGLYLIFILGIMPNLAGPESDVPPIDLAFHYSVDEVYGWIEAYGAAGRHRYMVGEMTFDVAYPIVYTCLFIGLIGYLIGFDERILASTTDGAGWFVWLVLLPPVIWVFDMLENIGIVTMLINFPVVLAPVATLTAWATSIKWSFAGLVIAITILLAVRKIVMKVRSR